MYNVEPDAFSYSIQNTNKIEKIEKELNAYFLINPINQLLKLVKDMNFQIGILQREIEELKEK